MNNKIIEFLASYLQKDIDIRNIVNDILGTIDPWQIETLILNSISSYITSEIEEIIFIEPCTGIVFGFLLKSGDKVVLKVYNKRNSFPYLEEMNRIQKSFVTENYPAPHVLSPIITFNTVYAGLYSFIEGKKTNPHNPIIRAELAKYLARFSEIVDKYQFTPIKTFMQESMKGKLWPVPHNVMFDFKKTSQGAGWIVKHALNAKKIIYKYKFPHKLSHTDWGIKNSTFKDNQLVGVFDWDALGSMSEPEMVGSAAAQFTADWESDYRITPTPAEARAFVKSYEEFRGRSFTKEEYTVVSASADYLIALISRFEHCDKSSPHHPFQDLLKDCDGKSFLFVK